MDMAGRTLTQVAIAVGGAAAALGSCIGSVAAQAIAPATADSVPRRPLGPVMRGTLVRISYTYSSIIGRMITASPDSITLFTDDAKQTFPRAPITRLDVSAGSYTNKGRYALIGGAGGAVLGAILGQAASGPKCGSVTSPHCDGIYIHEPAGLIAGGILFGVLGSVTGAIVGQYHPTERWTSVMSSEP